MLSVLIPFLICEKGYLFLSLAMTFFLLLHFNYDYYVHEVKFVDQSMTLLHHLSRNFSMFKPLA